MLNIINPLGSFVLNLNEITPCLETSHGGSTRCESRVVKVTGSWGSPDGQLYSTRPTTEMSFEPVRARSMRLSRRVSAENSTFRKHPTKLLWTRAPSKALGFTDPPTYTFEDDRMVNLPAMCEWSV